MHKIVFLDRETLGATLRPAAFEHSFAEHEATAPDEVVPRLTGATIAITNKVKINADAIAALPDLKLIAVAATGTDVIDLKAAAARGIVVSNIRGYAFNTVPEHVLALIFALKRNLLSYTRDVCEGVWTRGRQFCFLHHPITDVAGSTLGIVGYGALGKSIGKRAEALGMKVIAHDMMGGEGLVDFPTILRESDIITLHVPLTPETRGMIGTEQLRAMKPHAVLINTARGGLVDEQALADALRAGVIAGAGFDVLTSEPPKADNPLLAPDIPNLIITPHVAWASNEAMQILADQLMDNIDAFVAGAPRNVVG